MCRQPRHPSVRSHVHAPFQCLNCPTPPRNTSIAIAFRLVCRYNVTFRMIVFLCFSCLLQWKSLGSSFMEVLDYG